MAVKVVRELLRRNPAVPAERIGDVVIAATAQVGDQGLTLGRDVALLAGLPHTVPGFAVDRMCAGALTASTAAAGEIAIGACDLAIAGGVEHMGHHPMGEEVDFNPRFVAERLIDQSAAVMGETAENLHDAFPHLTREDADRYAAESQRRASAALGRGAGRGVRPDGRADGGARARGLGASPTATSSCARTRRSSDSRPCARRSGRRPRDGGQLRRAHRRRDGVPARRRGDGAPRSGSSRRCGSSGSPTPGVEPHLMGLGPVPATQQVLEPARAHARRRRAVRAERAVRRPGADLVRRARRRARTTDRLNPYGGAIACGHPLAATGVRLMAQLAYGFGERPDVRYGLTALCIGFGMGAALLWENLRHG